jgi:prepilin-type N-terminal cleavage/methylation domain-containing protein/prepilin-type processing-associated H-X9-DG protein
MDKPQRHYFSRGQEVTGDCRCAFSLVELLVVLGIIALLISLLMPMLNKARAQAKVIACQSNLRQIGQAMLIYANNNGGWMFPTGGIEDTDVRLRWFIYVLKPRTPLDPNSQDVKDWTPPIMLCPADDPDPGDYHSYLLNNHLLERNIRYSSKLPGGITPDHAVLAGEKKTSETHYFVETFDGPPPYSTYYGRDGNDGQVENYRHGPKVGSNYLYLDLHVDHNGPIELVYGMDPWDFPNAPPTTQQAFILEALSSYSLKPLLVPGHHAEPLACPPG